MKFVFQQNNFWKRISFAGNTDFYDWHYKSSADPLAELFTFNSPYSYAFNNPVNWSDPSGLAPEKAGHKDKILEMEEAMIVDGKRTFRNIDVTATRIYEGANIRCWAGDIRQEGLGILLEIQTDKENISYKLGQTAAQIRANLALDKAGNTALIRLEAGYDSPGPNPNSEIKGNSNGAGYVTVPSL